MVRSKIGSTNDQSDDNERLLYQLNHKILELRRRHIEACRNHQIEMDDIRNKIDALCGICDQISSARIPKRSKENERPPNSMETSLKQSSVAEVSDFNATNAVTTREVTIRKSALKSSENYVNQAYSPSPVRILRNRAEVTSEQSTCVSQTVREIGSATKTVRRVSFAKSIKFSEINEMLRIFKCKPCTIPLQDCERRLRKRKHSSL